jgi:hypothetical protein
MGYGFVQFFQASCVDKALKLLQHKMLDGHCLELKRSNRASTVEEVKTAKKESKDQNPEEVHLLACFLGVAILKILRLDRAYIVVLSVMLPLPRTGMLWTTRPHLHKQF